MAAGAIISALANIPWGQVVDNAPKLAEGAARLMRAVSGLRKPSVTETEEAHASASDAPTERAVLQREVEALRRTVVELQEQMRVSSRLLNDLTEQNIQLIQRIELNRVRLRWIGYVSGGALLACLTAVIYLFARLA